MPASRFLRPALVGVALLLLAGCQQVDPGPMLPPDPNAQNSVYVREIQPAPIETKKIPEGKSSLAPN